MAHEKFYQKNIAPITSEKVERKGQIIYQIGKIGMLCGLIGLILLALVIVCNIVVGYPGYTLLHLLSPLYLPVLFAYVCIDFGIVGIFLYFYGMKLFALGRIAYNTDLLGRIAHNTEKN